LLQAYPEGQTAQAMIVFASGDLHSALLQLLQSLQNPFAPGSVATVLVQESIAEQFVGLLAQNLRPLAAQVTQDSRFKSSLELVGKLGLKVVRGEGLRVEESPMLVWDVLHSFLNTCPSGAVTLHAFRTAKEAADLVRRDDFSYSQVSVWNEQLACSYELIPRLPKLEVFVFNCFRPDLSPVLEAFNGNRNEVILEKNHHYESLLVEGKRRLVVFPVGTIFAN
ncbi:hypothetical protein KR018_001411, partial [Drosophila ironensis]